MFETLNSEVWIAPFDNETGITADDMLFYLLLTTTRINIHEIMIHAEWEPQAFDKAKIDMVVMSSPPSTGSALVEERIRTTSGDDTTGVSAYIAGSSGTISRKLMTAYIGNSQPFHYKPQRESRLVVDSANGAFFGLRCPSAPPWSAYMGYIMWSEQDF